MTDSIFSLPETPAIEKKIGNTSVRAHWGVWFVFFDCGPDGRDGRAKWSLAKNEWVRTQFEVGAQFKATIKKAFNLPGN